MVFYASPGASPGSSHRRAARTSVDGEPDSAAENHLLDLQGRRHARVASPGDQRARVCVPARHSSKGRVLAYGLRWV